MLVDRWRDLVYDQQGVAKTHWKLHTLGKLAVAKEAGSFFLTARFDKSKRETSIRY